MPAAARRRATPAATTATDHLNVEVINGITLMSPRPAPGHASAANALAFALGPAFDDHFRSRRTGRPPRGPGGWRILSEPELHLRQRVRTNTLIPDLAGWRTARLPSLPKTAYFATAPDWICKVLSPGTETIDRSIKMPAYAKASVQNVWLVDVTQRTVDVFRLNAGTFQLVATHSGESRARLEPFPELILELATLWP